MSVATGDIFSPPDGASMLPEPGGRMATAVVRGVRIIVPCPDWCRLDHAAEDVLFLEDLNHWGAAVSLRVPTFAGGEERIMVARLSQYPFATGGHSPATFVSLSAVGDGETVELDAAGVERQAVENEAHAAQLRALAALI